MCEALEDIPGIIIVADDILIYGCGDSEEEAIIDHNEKLKLLLLRCREQNLVINEQKMKLL